MLTHARATDRRPTAPADSADARQALERIERWIMAQHALLERIVHHLEARHHARAADVILLNSIAAHVGIGITFSAAELWRHAERVDDALRAAIRAAAVKDTRALGRRLHRLTRHAAGPVRLACAGRDAAGKWWTVTLDRQD